MKLSPEMAKILKDIKSTILTVDGIRIGYSNEEEVDISTIDNFVLMSERVSHNLYHIDDIIISVMGVEAQITVGKISNDDKVKEFLDKIIDELRTGVLYFDPQITRKIGDLIITVRKYSNGKYSIKVQSGTSACINIICQKKDLIEKNRMLEIPLNYYEIILRVIHELG